MNATRGPRGLGPLWVWFIGLVIIIAAIVLLVDWVENRDERAATADTLRAEESATASAEQREAAIREVEQMSTPIGLEAIVPLGPADTGIQATFDGVVVGDVLDDGAWLRTAAGVVFLRIVDGEARLETGDSIAGRGIVRHDPARAAMWRAGAALALPERARVIGEYYLETTSDRLSSRSRDDSP